MNTAKNKARRITLIVMWQTVAIAQSPELAPLLPSGIPITKTMREALQTGDADRVAATADSHDPSIQALWLGILALTRDNPTKAIRILRHSGHPKALGVAYYMARQFILFRDQMEEAIRTDPNDFAPYYYSAGTMTLRSIMPKRPLAGSGKR